VGFLSREGLKYYVFELFQGADEEDNEEGQDHNFSHSRPLVDQRLEVALRLDLLCSCEPIYCERFPIHDRLCNYFIHFFNSSVIGRSLSRSYVIRCQESRRYLAFSQLGPFQRINCVRISEFRRSGDYLTPDCRSDYLVLCCRGFQLSNQVGQLMCFHTVHNFFEFLKLGHSI